MSAPSFVKTPCAFPVNLSPKLMTILQLWTKCPENIEQATEDQIRNLNQIACQSANQVRKKNSCGIFTETY